MNSVNSILNENVPDPSDFPPPSTAPGLRRLDATFRCSICGDTYDAPVTLPCGHCFCSGCLRPAMALKQECPGCRRPANEGHIRPNYVMEEAISAWNESRPYILDLIQRNEKPSMATPKKSQHHRKRKRTDSTSSIELLDATPSSSRLQSMNPNCSKSPAGIKKGPSFSRIGDLGVIPSSDVEEDEMPTAINPKPKDVVECPLCSKSVQLNQVNAHIDRGCQDPAKTNSSLTWSKIMTKPRSKQKGKQRLQSDSDEDSPLPKVSYATLKEKQIRDMLLEHKLPIYGDRAQLERRHQRWIMIYNANLDRSIPNRRNKAILRQELKKWEDNLSKRKKTSIPNPTEHVKTHKSEFDRLVNLARGSKHATSRAIPSSVSPQPMSPDAQSIQEDTDHPNIKQGGTAGPADAIVVD